MEEERRQIRLIPHIGVVSEATQPVVPTPNKHHWRRGELMFTISMTDIQSFTLSIASAVDAKGNPVPIPAGSMSWAVDNPNILALTPSADGSSCLVAAVGPLGVGNVTVTLEDSTGKALATGQAQVTIVASAPVTITLAGTVPA